MIFAGETHGISDKENVRSLTISVRAAHPTSSRSSVVSGSSCQLSRVSRRASAWALQGRKINPPPPPPPVPRRVLGTYLALPRSARAPQRREHERNSTSNFQL